jgi:drug/metabolite transporter (DMT)-like permease
LINPVLASVKRNKKGIILILCSAICTSFGQAFWKLFNDDQWLLLIFGFVLYIFGAVLMIIAFRYGSLSVLHPLLSLGYFFALFIGVFLLNEVVTYQDIAGVLIILAGVLMVGGGD